MTMRLIFAQYVSHLLYAVILCTTLYPPISVGGSVDRPVGPTPDPTQWLYEPITPIPETVIDQRLYRLGKRLFHDKRLDKNKKISCSSCHDLDKGGSDGKISPTLRTNSKIRNNRLNTPTVYNVIFNDTYYWEARFQSLDEQLDDALLELNDSWIALARIVSTIPSYNKQFTLAYPDGLTPTNLKGALKYFISSLNTPNSLFDQYLRGKKDALNKSQKAGYQLFKSYGCIACHQGINVGGNLILPLQEITLDKFSPKLANTEQSSDNKQDNNNKIRVPSLRNVALTAPYLHNGSVASLEGAVNHMAQKQLGLTIPKREADLIVRFLKSLTGEYNGRML